MDANCDIDAGGDREANDTSIQNCHRRVLVAGATGYLGQYVIKEFVSRGWQVVALSRREVDFGPDVRCFIGEATKPDTIQGCMEGVHVVVSCLGLTRQRDGLSYNDVDYQANVNLLDEAVSAGVSRFAYTHVLHSDKMKGVEMVDSKQKFVEDLQSRKVIASTIICPSGFFSDMQDFLDMARSGRVWLFGDGSHKINPIHGADLATEIANMVERGDKWSDVGGPEVFTHKELAELAYECIGSEVRIICLWDVLRMAALRVVNLLAPVHIRGPAQFFLTAFGMDMVGKSSGKRTLKEHWKTPLPSNKT